nr:hypothetical protein [Tanacetum cinerariifolium]
MANPEGNPESFNSHSGKEIKELIKKDELTIANLEGVGVEMLKSRYKNDVELEYHVDQIKASMAKEAKWSDIDDDDLTKP